jgi:hypothetical protein
VAIIRKLRTDRDAATTWKIQGELRRFERRPFVGKLVFLYNEWVDGMKNGGIFNTMKRQWEIQITAGLKITGDRSPVKMTGQLDFSSVKICFWPVTDTLTLTVKQIIRNFVSIHHSFMF